MIKEVELIFGNIKCTNECADKIHCPIRHMYSYGQIIEPIIEKKQIWNPETHEFVTGYFCNNYKEV